MAEQKNTIPKTSIRALLPVAVVGLASLWAWMLLLVFAPVGTAGGGTAARWGVIAPEGALSHAFCMAGFFAGAVLGAAVIMRRGVRPFSEHPVRSFMAGYAATVPACAIAGIASIGNIASIPGIVEAAAFALAGASFSRCLVGFAGLLAIEWRRDVGSQYGFGMMAATALAFVLSHVTFPVSALAVACLPALAYGACLFLERRVFDAGGAEASARDDHIEFFRFTGLTVAAYGVLFGVVAGFLAAQPLTHATLVPAAGAIVAGAAAQNVFGHALKRYLPFGVIEKIMLVALAAGFLALFCVPAPLDIPLCVVLLALFVAFDLADLSALTALASTDRGHGVQHVARGRMGIPFGLVVGLGVCTAVRATDPAFGQAFPPMLALGCLGLLLVLAIAAVFVPVRDNTVADSTAAWNRTVDSLLEAKCAEVSERFKLSARESQVIVYLARGRNAEYIGEHLCISAYTAKAHIYHIYRKMGVNAQAELMDIVEQTEVPLL